MAGLVPAISMVEAPDGPRLFGRGWPAAPTSDRAGRARPPEGGTVRPSGGAASRFGRRQPDRERRFFFQFCTMLPGRDVSAFRWSEPRPIRTGPLEFESKNPLNLLSFFIFRSEVDATTTRSRSGKFPRYRHKGFPQLGNFPPPGVPGAAFFCHTRPIGVLVGGGNGVAVISP
jgi:hypothetical protein